MKTFAEELEKRQPELTGINLEEDLELTMHLANTKMRIQELLDTIRPEYADWFIAGWGARGESLEGVDEIISRFTALGRTIYDEISRKLGINEPLT